MVATPRRPRRAHRARSLAAVSAGLAIALSALVATGASADPVQPECASTESGAVLVTPDCVDPAYANVVIDGETDETAPVPHHRVSGHFEGTDISVTIYLPPAEQWEGRFFQYTYPITFTAGEDLSQATDRAIGFAIASGGYAVQAGNAGLSLGYRHTAAAALFAERYAADYYDTDEQIHGYLYGPSGGSFQTIGAAENTSGVWDGYVPMVLGTPMSNPYNFTIRAAAELILGDKAEQISDAVLPGGSGKPYAGLNAGEKAMLKELVSFGVPLRAWENSDYLLGYSEQFPDGLSGFLPFSGADEYVAAFWSEDGYLGTEDSSLGDAVRAALAERGDTPENRSDIASRFIYRHQLPAADSGYVGFDQFRDDDGEPLYPQLTPVWGPLITGGVGGNAAWDGSIEGKMIVVDNLYDSDALPYHADWYAQRVEASLGARTFRDSFRLYYNDHADHQDAPPTGDRATYLVNWYGMVEQALRDISAWVEDGTNPPRSSQYTVTNAQVSVPAKAARSGGIQPTVDLSANLRTSVTVRVGQPVLLTACIQVVPGTGEVVEVAWDLEGSGDYTARTVRWPRELVVTARTVRFDEPGIYYVAVRTTVQRDGVVSPYAQVQNLDRVRVVVVDRPGYSGH